MPGWHTAFTELGLNQSLDLMKGESFPQVRRSGIVEYGLCFLG